MTRPLCTILSYFHLVSFEENFCSIEISFTLFSYVIMLLKLLVVSGFVYILAVALPNKSRRSRQVVFYENGITISCADLLLFGQSHLHELALFNCGDFPLYPILLLSTKFAASPAPDVLVVNIYVHMPIAEFISHSFWLQSNPWLHA